MTATNQTICTRCVMDRTDPDIQFFPDGRCSCCRDYDEVSTKDLHSDHVGQTALINLIDEIKRKGLGKDYDCLIGMSGGVDSSYVAYLVAKKYGLRALAVHLDNGWNTELAVANVEKLVKTLGIDLITHVLDWNEFKDIQLSFIKSGISNIEIPTDHAIWAVLLKTAAKMKIPFVIAGNNVVTESVMPKSWLYGSKDSMLIKDIHKRFGKVQMKSYPSLSTFDYVNYLIFRGIRWVPILNYINFNKAEAKKFLMTELGWRDYGGKHYESIFTRFFHSSYLTERFGFDLRKAYLSALVCSNQISRSDALDDLKLPPASDQLLKTDRQYVLKKLGLTENEYKAILTESTKTYRDYKNSDSLWRYFSAIVKWARARVTRV
jgi:N-acetyl sugar amidotransferase